MVCNGDFSCHACLERFCAHCNEGYDYGPTVRLCGHCNQTMCDSCGEHVVCSECISAVCSLCADIDGVETPTSCGARYCYESMCMACRLPDDPNDLTDCESCRAWFSQSSSNRTSSCVTRSSCAKRLKSCERDYLQVWGF